MASINDSVLLMLVGMLNFLGAILLAQNRTKVGTEGSASIPAASAVRLGTESAPTYLGEATSAYQTEAAPG